MAYVIRKGDPWKKVCTAIKKFVTILFISSAISFSTERTEFMITDTVETITYTETAFSLNVSLATDSLSS